MEGAVNFEYVNLKKRKLREVDNFEELKRGNFGKNEGNFKNNFENESLDKVRQIRSWLERI